MRPQSMSAVITPLQEAGLVRLTRACAFCNVKTGIPGALDANEPDHVAEATAKLSCPYRRHLGRP